MNNSIIPECYIDTALIEVLGFVNPNHQLNNSEVIKTLELRVYNNIIGIGIIDRDKNQPKRFTTDYTKKRTVADIELYQKNDHSKRYIIVHPVIEKWIDNEAEKFGISRTKFGLPQDFKAFKNITKSTTSKKNPQIRQYLNTIFSQQNSAFKILKNLLDELLQQG